MLGLVLSKYGTLPFSILARYAFIASQILKDMEKIGQLSSESVNKFFNSIETVASESSAMYDDVQNGNLSLDILALTLLPTKSISQKVSLYTCEFLYNQEEIL